MLTLGMRADDVTSPNARSGALWRDIEQALARQGAGMSAGRGDHMRIAFRGRRAVLRRPGESACAFLADLAPINRLLRGEALPPAVESGALKVGNYTAAIEYRPESDAFHAQAVDIHDVITTWGRNRSELREAFAAAIEDYRWFCKARGEYAELPRHPAGSGSARILIPL